MFPGSTVIAVSPLQRAKTPVPMLVTAAGIVRLVRPVQSSNANSPMLVTVAGIATLVTRSLPVGMKSNGSIPMAVTGRPRIVAGNVTAPPTPVYSVIVTASLEIENAKSPDR